MSLVVVHAASGREWRGGQRQVWLLARELARLGDIEQTVVTARGGELARRLRADGVAVRPVGWRAGLDPRALLGLRRELRRAPGPGPGQGPGQGPALVHAHDAHALALAGLALAGLARRGTGIPLVATRRVTFPLRRPGYWARAARVLALSAPIRAALLAGGVRPERIEIVPSGLDLDHLAGLRPSRLRHRLGVPEGTPLALTLAALTPEKGHEVVLQAAALGRADLPDLHWVLVGNGPRRSEIARRIGMLGLAERVRLLDEPPDAEVLLAEATVLALSPAAEGFGSAALAALALGVPVVATAVGGLAELLASGVGLLVPPGDPGALWLAVRRVVSEPELHRELARRGRRRAQDFSARRMAERVWAVYRSCTRPH